MTVSCSEPGAFEITHVSSGSATHKMAIGKSMGDAAGPLEYDDVSFKCVCIIMIWAGCLFFAHGWSQAWFPPFALLFVASMDGMAILTCSVFYADGGLVAGCR